MNIMTDPRDVILELRKVIFERGLTAQKISELSEAAGTFVSTSTVRHLMQDDWESRDFSFRNVVMPLANILLDVNHRESYDTSEVSAMKELLLSKKEIIEKLEARILRQEEEKKELQALYEKKLQDAAAAYQLKLEQEQARFDGIIDFRRSRISKLDEMNDDLRRLNAKKDDTINDLLSQIRDLMQKLLDKCDHCELRRWD